MTLADMEVCPCRSSEKSENPVSYGDCCGRFHRDSKSSLPETPEQLMRSRYSAFVLGLDDYLRLSWHDSTCPAGALSHASTRWLGLLIEESGIDSECLFNDTSDRKYKDVSASGYVAFRARFLHEENRGEFQELRERSRFVKQEGRWLYLDGDAEWLTLTPGRNDPCPCGSGRKFKKCCAN
ncbi:MAG: YchJ family protein [Oceanobacter sp.]